MSARLVTIIGLLQVVLAAALWGTVGIGTKLLYGMAQTDALSVGFFGLRSPSLRLPVRMSPCCARAPGKCIGATCRS